MSRSTISTFRLFELFPNEEAARKYIENRLWKDGIYSFAGAIYVGGEKKFKRILIRRVQQ